MADKEQEWSEWNRRTAETIAKTQAASLEASRAFFEAWQRAVPVQPSPTGNGAAHVPFQAAGDAWMRAVAEAGRRTQEAFASGKTLGPDDFVDIWTRVAAEVGTSIVEDPLFAQMTGQTVNANMQVREELRVQRDARLKELGVASAADVSEVGRRLVELERRIHELTRLVRGDAPSVSMPVKGADVPKSTKKAGRKEA